MLNYSSDSVMVGFKEKEEVIEREYYSVVKTYVETSRKNKIYEMEALSRLCAGNPYTVDEIFT